MSEAAIQYITDNFNLDKAQARALVNDYIDQIRQFGQAPGQRPPPTPPTGEGAPPAREVHPWWYITNTWQMLEPTIAWPLGIYQMAKMGLAATSGLPASAALPRRLGGMTARELWGAARNPATAQQWQSYLATPRAQRVTFERPTTPRIKPPTPPGAAGGLTGVPRVLGVSAWMPAAGIIGGVTVGPAGEVARRLGTPAQPIVG